ncbi:MAG: glycine/sarcosine/betaine reductase component B subunit, partial [Candidatus Binatia bacterium]
MQLTLAYHPVNSMGFGERLSLDGMALTVSQGELRAIVLEDPLIDAVDFAVAAPNDSLRAGPVFDIVEPRAKAPGGSP